MPIILKSSREIELMRRAGRIGYQILQTMERAAVAGITTAELDGVARTELQKHNAVSLSLNFPTYKPGEGYPGYTCLSVNEEVVHGVPCERKLKDGDIVSIDLALSIDGFCADMARTIPIGVISPRVRKLVDVTRETFEIAVANMKVGRKWSDIARLMQYNVEKNGFEVVREFVGHGIGRTMHEDPKIPNFATAEQVRGDFKLKPGMTLAVEPMVVMGRRDVVMLEDGWTVVTEDRMPAAHHENTVAMGPDGPDILTDGH